MIFSDTIIITLLLILIGLIVFKKDIQTCIPYNTVTHETPTNNTKPLMITNTNDKNTPHYKQNNYKDYHNNYHNNYHNSKIKKESHKNKHKKFTIEHDSQTEDIKSLNNMDNTLSDDLVSFVEKL